MVVHNIIFIFRFKIMSKSKNSLFIVPNCQNV